MTNSERDDLIRAAALRDRARRTGVDHSPPAERRRVLEALPEGTGVRLPETRWERFRRWLGV